MILLLLALQADLQADLAAIRAVGREGAGHPEAAAAWSRVVARGAAAYLPVLEAFDGADARAANWLRSAADAIGGDVDPKALEAFVLDVKRNGEARRIAYERIVRVDPTAPARLLRLDDPGRELRRDAVARALPEAKDAEALAKLLVHARDRDQVDELAKRLKAAGAKVDLQAHYGVVARWAVVASFDNAGMKGFAAAYPPERAVDLAATGEGKGGKPLRVVEVSTPDPHGKVDLNAALGKEMGAVAYAFAAVESDVEREVELRVATNNAVKIFLNGALVAFRDEYHHGMKMDQYVGRGRLRRGRNELLLKICQNEQKEDWAQTWSFQARLCDALGGAVAFRNVTEVPSR